MKLGKLFKSYLVRRHVGCPEGHICLRLTGEPPGNLAERVVKDILDERTSMPLDWLEERLSERLYRAELRRGAGALDIGFWGPDLFREEAARILAGVCPKFGCLVEDSGLAEPVECGLRDGEKPILGG